MKSPAHDPQVGWSNCGDPRAYWRSADPGHERSTARLEQADCSGTRGRGRGKATKKGLLFSPGNDGTRQGIRGV